MLPNRLKHLMPIQNMISRRFLSNAPKHVDIIIAGGGMVGTSLACALGKNKKLSCKSVLLLEGSKKTAWQLTNTYSNRVSALNPASVKLLQDIGAWKHIENARFGPVKRLQVMDAVSDAMITFDNDFLNNVACVVENDVLLNAVQKELGGNVNVVYESKINGITNNEVEQKMRICLADGTEYTCDLLLACDGANSFVRKSLGFHHVSYNYDQMGVVATLNVSEDFENVVAWQRHLPSGFLALLPLKNGLSSLVWSTKTSHAKQLLALSEEEFVAAINDAICKVHEKSSIIEQATKSFDNLVRFFNLPSTSNAQIPLKICGCESKSRAAFPLGLGHSTNYVGKGVALVGDAAHRVHPLAGQGVNLGFGDVICLNRILGEAVYSGSKIEDLSVLKEYETERQRRNVPIMLAVHGLFKLYGTQFTPLVFLRSLGMQATHAIPPLKKLIMAQAS